LAIRGAVGAQCPTFGEIQDGGGRPLCWISFSAHISVDNEDICVTFGTQIDNGHTKVNRAQNSTYYVIQDGVRQEEFYARFYFRNTAQIILKRNSVKVRHNKTADIILLYATRYGTFACELI